jgi:hypothetical protein
MNQPSPDRQSQEQNNHLENLSVGRDLNYNPVQNNYYGSQESEEFKEFRKDLIQRVQNEIKDRLELFKNRNKYINSSLKNKPEFVSQIDPMTCKKKQKVDNKEIQDIDALFKHFREKDLPESLLIVGDPASGLTTVLCTIAEILLEKANKDENQPVPVYLSIRSWDGDPLENWLEKAVNKHYCIPIKEKGWLERILYKILGNRIYNSISSDKKSHLIEPENLVILLDHFELVQDNKQENLIEELNRYKTSNIVLCSRLEAWNHYILIDENNPDNTNKLLEFNEAFLLKPPTSSEIQDYSSSVLNESNSDNANKLKNLIKPGQKLEDITKSLFILNLVLDTSYIYEELINLNVLNVEKEELYQKILKMYVDNTLKEIDEKLKRPKETVGIVKNLEKTYWEKIKPKVKPMLKWLAQEMCDNLPDKNDKPKPYFLIEEMQPTALKGIAKTFYHFGSVSLAVLLSFLVGTLHLLIQPVDAWKYALLTGISGAIFVFFFFLDGKGEIKPVDRSEWNFQTVKENSLKALFLSPLAFLIGFICSFLEGRGLVELYEKGFERVTKVNSISDLVLGMIYTIIITVVIIMLYSVTVGKSSSNVKKIKPNQGIWTSSYNCGVTGFRVFLVASVIFWLLGVTIQQHPLMLATRYGIGYGLMAGMLYAIGCNSGRACIRHFTLRSILFFARGTPWNYAKFLNVAVDNLEFLQRAGGKFLFINRDLRDIFLDYQ